MIELVSSDSLPYVCLHPGCAKVYMWRPAGYQVPAGCYSSGYCEEHKHDLEEQLYGKRRVTV